MTSASVAAASRPPKVIASAERSESSTPITMVRSLMEPPSGCLRPAVGRAAGRARAYSDRSARHGGFIRTEARAICGFPAVASAAIPDAPRRRRAYGAAMPTNVLIAGAGPAGLEAALALQRLAGDRVATTVLAPEAEFMYRPLSVLEPFEAGSAAIYPLERVAHDADFRHVRGRLAGVDADAREVLTAAAIGCPTTCC